MTETIASQSVELGDSCLLGVDPDVDPAPQSQLRQRKHHDLAAEQDRERPPREQLELPADDDSGGNEQPVRQRVEQDPEPAVLPGDPGGDAVEVVGTPENRVEGGRGCDPAIP